MRGLCVGGGGDGSGGDGAREKECGWGGWQGCCASCDVGVNGAALMVHGVVVKCEDNGCEIIYTVARCSKNKNVVYYDYDNMLQFGLGSTKSPSGIEATSDAEISRRLAQA